MCSFVYLLKFGEDNSVPVSILYHKQQISCTPIVNYNLISNDDIMMEMYKIDIDLERISNAMVLSLSSI